MLQRQVEVQQQVEEKKQLALQQPPTKPVVPSNPKSERSPADFGIARELSTRDVASTMIGTPNYLSPEICEGRKYDTSR